MSKESEIWGALGKMAFLIHSGEHAQTRCYVAFWALLMLGTNHYANYGADWVMGGYYGLSILHWFYALGARRKTAKEVQAILLEAQKAAGG